MEKKDYLYLSLKKYHDLRECFKDLWDNDPLALNSFIFNGEFALYDLNIVLLGGKIGVVFTFNCHYQKKTKTLFINDEENGYYGEVRKMKVLEGHFLNETNKHCLQQDTIVYYDDKRSKERIKSALAAQGKTIQDWITDVASVFFTFNLIAMNLPRKLKEHDEKATKTICVKKKGNKTYKSIVYLKHTYIIDDEIKITKSELRHIIKCPCWGVRGHARHLKNGKVVYVKPYKKGKDRNNADAYVGKQYEI